MQTQSNNLQDQIKLLIGSLVCCIDGECSNCSRFHNGIEYYFTCAAQLKKDANEMVDFLDKCSRVAGGGRNELNDKTGERITPTSKD